MGGRQRCDRECEPGGVGLPASTGTLSELSKFASPLAAALSLEIVSGATLIGLLKMPFMWKILVEGLQNNTRVN